MNKRKLFNIYYLNFSKVYEIAMILNNKVTKTITSEILTGNEKSQHRNSKLSVDYMNTIKSEINEINALKTYSSDKIIETLEVKTTKSILLRDILDNCKNIEIDSSMEIGDLIYINGVTLSLENETELRSFKMLRNDAISGLNYQGIDISNLINSMLNDYAYTITGRSEKLKNSILMKIPMINGNEFESLYTINDLLIGKVSLIGIYRGKAKISELKNNITVFNSNENSVKKSNFNYDTSDGVELTTNNIDENTENDYDFIDIIAIVQNLNYQVSDQEKKTEHTKNVFFRNLINKLFRRNTKC